MADTNDKKSKTREIRQYLKLIDDERKAALQSIEKEGFPDGLDSKKAYKLLMEEYLFLKRAFREKKHENLMTQDKYIIDNSEFGYVSKKLFLVLTRYSDKTTNSINIFEEGMPRYFADGVYGFESLRRLMMIKGVFLIITCKDENRFNKGLMSFFPKECMNE